MDRRGTIAWWCVPRFDSPSVFASLLDTDAGCWTMQPVGASQMRRHYVGDSLVLRRVFVTQQGEAAVTDVLALEPGRRGTSSGCAAHIF